MKNDSVGFMPESVCRYFEEITQLPHPSANQEGVKGNENPVRRYVSEKAMEIPGVNVKYYIADAVKPGERVVVLSRPGSGKYASQKPVILQAHMDMVYNPVDMEFPLSRIIDTSHSDGTWIKARDAKGRDSTLGADDGIGVATALGILSDDNLKEYPVECLFTVQEETDMGGAQNCDLSNLTGTILLNLDAEDLKVIIYGSAGGAETVFDKEIFRTTCPQDYEMVKVSISDLRGGHSGVDINKGRLNALKVLDQVLVRLNKRITDQDEFTGGIDTYNMFLCDFKRDDVIKSNAIPGSAEAVIAIPQEQKNSFSADFTRYCELLKDQNQPVESNFTCSVTEIESSSLILDSKSTDAVLCIINQIPAGVISMIPEVPGVVETSSNLYDVKFSDNAVAIRYFNRSSRDMSMEALNKLQSCIGDIFDCGVKTGQNSSVSWQPDENNVAYKAARKVYTDIYKDEAVATVVHAGLECGTLASRFLQERGVKLDCVSIGPTIKNPHTPNESLEIKSGDGFQTVQQFYLCVSRLICELYSEDLSETVVINDINADAIIY